MTQVGLTRDLINEGKQMRVVRLSMLILAMILVAPSMARAQPAQSNSPTIVSTPVQIEEKNTLYLIEYGNEGRRCYVIRTFKDGGSNGSDGTDSEISCNRLPVLGPPMKVIVLAGVERDLLYTITNSRTGDICTLLQTEKSYGDADVSIDCSFGN